MSFTADTWLSLAALICSILGPLIVYLVRGAAKTEADDAVETMRVSLEEAHEALKKTVIDHDRRMITLEERDRAGPQAADIKEITAKLAEIAGDMKAMKTEVHALSNSQDRTERSLGLINETLLSGATK